MCRGEAGRGLLVQQDEGKAKDRAVQQDVQDTLARAADLIDQSKREVERARQIIKDSDLASERANVDDKADEEPQRPSKIPSGG